MKTIFLIATTALFLFGCTITQQVEQANISNDAEICIIENDAVREGFLPELQNVLHEKGINHVVVDWNYANKNCEWTLTYTARWSWDLAMYMSYAEIKVFKNGELDGEAIYDSTGGGANTSKFIDAEPKIRELVEELMQRESGQ
jgi:hypothetical protein